MEMRLWGRRDLRQLCRQREAGCRTRLHTGMDARRSRLPEKPVNIGSRPRQCCEAALNSLWLARRAQSRMLKSRAKAGGWAARPGDKVPQQGQWNPAAAEEASPPKVAKRKAANQPPQQNIRKTA